MNSAQFQVEVTQEDALAFARVSGDWNPLHTDLEYAKQTIYKQPILHGAFSAGLVSRLAGMYLPGQQCLLHNMQLRFVAPIKPPVSLLVHGRQVSQGDTRRVEATITDVKSGIRYVDAAYEFSLHTQASGEATPESPRVMAETTEAEPILVTGASGDLGQSLLHHLGGRALGVSRSSGPGFLAYSELRSLGKELGGRRIAAIVHCAWPSPDNQQLLRIGDLASAIDYQVAAPLRDMVTLAQVLAQHGSPEAVLILIGSTAAWPGRHNYRAPLYSLGKGLVSQVAQILAVELGAARMRCVALVFDVIEGGMNKNLSPMARLAHQDRTPSGHLATPQEAAAQIAWVLENRSLLLSGATITLSGGALP